MSAIDAPNPSLLYIQCDIPEGMTLRDWRRTRHEPRASGSPMSSVLRRVRRARRTRQERFEI